jgi:AcrR family transcriptional regulator
MYDEIGTVQRSAKSVKIGCTPMSNENKPRRKYELKQRADEMAATRLRITQAAVELHGTIGPARTTVSAVAEKAGVQRHTVYRHFPTDAELFGACSAHYAIENPMPDQEPWCAIGDPTERLTRALDDLYSYYERTEPMFSNVLRDVDFVDSIAPVLAPRLTYMEEAAENLARGWRVRGRKRHVLDAAVRHAIDFQTWRSLTTDGDITRAEALELAVGLVVAASVRTG